MIAWPSDPKSRDGVSIACLGKSGRAQTNGASRSANINIIHSAAREEKNQ
jgi:hypothetical protein